MSKKYFLRLIPVPGSAFFSFKNASMKTTIEKDNELTAAEKKAGWVLLFDGK